jgi:hypothetical protein
VAAGALFAATVVLLFAGPFTMRGSPDASWWIRLGGWGAAPALFAVLWLWSSLLAASLIDAETGYIPLGITSLAIAVGLVSMTAQSFVPLAVSEHLIRGWPSGLPSAMWCGCSSRPTWAAIWATVPPPPNPEQPTPAGLAQRRRPQSSAASCNTSKAR